MQRAQMPFIAKGTKDTKGSYFLFILASFVSFVSFVVNPCSVYVARRA